MFRCCVVLKLVNASQSVSVYFREDSLASACLPPVSAAHLASGVPKGAHLARHGVALRGQLDVSESCTGWVAIVC